MDFHHLQQLSKLLSPTVFRFRAASECPVAPIAFAASVSIQKRCSAEIPTTPSRNSYITSPDAFRQLLHANEARDVDKLHFSLKVLWLWQPTS
ncbi:unnamed protein product [Sphagnum troendelagicum]|uniref:Uncharacterized protein n=1 Tax=Sphagnum troendelagicum TaxID=128251 RepID=A0ABP0UYL7_9BRYO